MYGSAVQTGMRATAPFMKTSNSTITRLSNPTYVGYEFNGWYTNVELRTPLEDDPTSMPDENAAYYAKWTVIFHDDESSSTAVQTVTPFWTSATAARP